MRFYHAAPGIRERNSDSDAAICVTESVDGGVGVAEFSTKIARQSGFGKAVRCGLLASIYCCGFI